jgi:phosphorylated CTD-interacting factor 1
MPSFERWLLDSKLEESDRLHSIIVEWLHNPSMKLEFTDSSKIMKKKYGRAARYDGLKGGDTTSSARRQERERARSDKDCKLVLEAEKRTMSSLNRQQQHPQPTHDLENTILRNIDRDAILPYNTMETDPSSDRLIKEIIASMASTNDTSAATDSTRNEENAMEIVRELCHRSGEACKELHHLEQRLGKYQKFSWDMGSGDSRKRRNGGGSKGGSIDHVLVEWHDNDQLCSLVYVPKKQKSLPRGASDNSAPTSHSASMSSEGNNQQEENSASTKSKAKPFVVKLNGSHYQKLRIMFDSSYHSPETLPRFATNRDQTMTTSFHAVLFSLIIRYSALSGGQLLNDLRGGGMQGAVHGTVFDCLAKWFGQDGSALASTTATSGTECFASPFNSALTRYFSAFPSPDLDGHFGSYGDFFYPTSSSLSSSNNNSIFHRPGWHELNPPFSPGVMTKMAHRINELLELQTSLELDVTYVVIIPTVRSNTTHADKPSTKMKRKEKHHKGDDGNNTTVKLMNVVNQAATPPFIQLTKSPYCKCHIILPSREHGYIEGSQHLRPTQYKESQYTTSVIVLRTNISGKRRSLMDDEDDEGAGATELFEKEMREAFASRHAMEVAQRKAK